MVLCLWTRSLLLCFHPSPWVGHSQKFIKPYERECRVLLYSLVRKFIQFLYIMKDLFNYKVVCLKNKGTIYCIKLYFADGLLSTCMSDLPRPKSFCCSTLSFCNGVYSLYIFVAMFFPTTFALHTLLNYYF